MEPESRPRAVCCFWSSSRSNDRKKKSSRGVSGFNVEDGNWGKDDEMLSDMSTFSVKEQERRLKKAKEEEERVSREAEKVVQWVKQESARMDVSAIKNITIKDDDPIK